MSAFEKAGDYIRECLKTHRGKSPLFVGIQGPQGSGKSYTASHVMEYLGHSATQQPGSAGCSGLRVVSFSLDDLYLKASDLDALSQKNNRLLMGRGPPGTHDISFGVRIMQQLKKINDECDAHVDLPMYDKSANNGRGDRSAHTSRVYGPVDVVVFEGWMTAFARKNDETIAQIQNCATSYSNRYSLEEVLTVAHDLDLYIPMWNLLDVVVELQTESLENVFAWRLEQEHAMKARNGSVGMTDDQVKEFILRYMPTYETSIYPESNVHWHKRGIVLAIGEDRAVRGVSEI